MVLPVLPDSPTVCDDPINSPFFSPSRSPIVDTELESALAELDPKQRERFRSILQHRHRLDSLQISSNETKPTDDAQFDQPKLVDRVHVPPYYLPYQFVSTGYRIHYTKLLAWKSTFHWHNETVNIWTEILPLLTFLIVDFVYILPRHPVISQTDSLTKVLIIIAMLGGHIFRPLISALAHIFYCQSQKCCEFWWNCDFASIGICTACQCLILAHFTFWCSPHEFWFFAPTVLGALLLNIVPMYYLRTERLRAASTVILILTTHIVLLASQLRTDITSTHHLPRSTIFYWILGVALHAAGFVMKQLGAPERFSSHRFFQWGLTSHTLWHLFVNAGEALSIPAWISYLEWRSNIPC